MAQLVKLQERAGEFKAADAEVIVVFREEMDGVEGLEKSKQRAKSTFRLGLDLGKKKTAAYSPKRRQFANYVIDRKGIVRGIVDGDLRDRATADELMAFLKKINDGTSKVDDKKQK
jgi:thioredoxin-dependent peroxiredoxin